MILDVPRFKCFIKKEFVTNNKETGFLEAYCFAVTLIEARPLLFTVHTIDGALYSRLPITALRAFQSDSSLGIRALDKWGAISSNGQVIEHEYLKDYRVKVLISKDFQVEGVYKFTIDYFHGGFAEDPEQHKCSHIIELESGEYAALPNNMCLFLDSHFTNKEVSTRYERNEQYFYLED